MSEGQKGHNGFVVAGSQPAVLLQAPEKALDFVAVLADFLVHGRRFRVVEVAGNDGLDTMLAQ